MRTIWLISILLVVYYTDAKCPTKLFGVGCRFECHCQQKEECDLFTGECPSGCDINWTGPGCQYRNVAVGAFTEHSDGSSNSNLAIDGDISTCTDMKDETTGTTKPWWRIYLAKNHTIREIEFITDDSSIGNFTEFKVTVEHVPEELAQLKYDSYIHPKQTICYESKGKISGRVINVVCNKVLMGDQVRIQLGQARAKLVICDFRIFEGRNIAYGRRASQSSPNSGQSASSVVDGNTQTHKKDACSVMNTDTSPWWSVDLAHVNVIDRILITPLKTNVIRGHHLFASNDSLTWVSVYNDTERFQLRPDIKVAVSARFMKVVFENETSQLTICEIQIFGDCLPDVCGFDCADVCHCANPNSHIKMSGNCSNGCQEKWTGEGKKCDRAIFCTESSDVTLVIITATVAAVATLLISGSVYIIARVIKRRHCKSESRCCQVCPGTFKGFTTRLATYYNTANFRKTKKTVDELEGYTDLDTTAMKRGGIAKKKQSTF